jgi:ABC-type transporter Mla MlaB component
MWNLWLAADDEQFMFEVAGVLNGDTGEAIAEALESVMRYSDGRRRRIRLSLAAVGQADHAGIQVLRRCRARAQMRGLTLQICELSQGVRGAIRHSQGARGEEALRLGGTGSASAAPVHRGDSSH